MGDLVHQLEWDSEFFGFPIARVDLQGIDDAGLAAIEAEARDEGILCAYGTLDPADIRATILLQEGGYRFVEAAITFSLQVDEPEIPAPSGVSIRLGASNDLPALEEAAAALAPWSRFSVDPRFGGDAARRLQRAWIERAALCETGERQLVVAERQSEIVAFITRCSSPEPIVDSVGTVARGSGAARYLIEDARQWAGGRPLLGGPIAARNVDALRYVSHCNYRVSRCQYHFHRWFDEGSRVQP